MTLFYCKKCKKAVDDKRPQYDGQKKICPTCSQRLYYFGKESVRISPEDVIKEYDKHHEYRPLRDFSGEYYHDESRSLANTTLLECEDMLIHDPTNIKALSHMGTYEMSQGNLERAEYWLEKVIAQEHSEPAIYKRLIYVYIHRGRPIKAEQLLARFEAQESSLTYLETKGKIDLLKKDYTKALDTFKRALDLCKDEEKKRDILTCISNIKRLDT
jgi:tetratricopeptide (TPR) repeat protein